MTVRHWPSIIQVTLLIALARLIFVVPWPTPLMAASERAFRIRCAVPCGSLPPFMAGRLRVGPPVAFWRALLLAALAVVGGGLALRKTVQAKIANPASP